MILSLLKPRSSNLRRFSQRAAGSESSNIRQKSYVRRDIIVVTGHVYNENNSYNVRL